MGRGWMGGGNAWMGGDGLYEGIAQQPPTQVPAYTPVSIGSHTYALETSKYKRATMPALRPPMDQVAEPGEQSLNNAGLWRRSQSDWRFGSNQLMFDEADSKHQRYWASKGLNPHPDTPSNAYQLRMHKDVSQVRSSANTNLMILVATPNVYVVDGAELYWTAAFNGGSTVWTAAGMSAATGGATILSVCFDGAYVYACVGAGGIYRTANASTVCSQFNAVTHTLNICAYANGNLFASALNNLYQMNAQGQINGDTVANVGTLTSATGTSAITSLAVSPLLDPVATGAVITVSVPGHSDTFAASGPAAIGATSIPVTSHAPSFNYPIGTSVMVQQLVGGSPSPTTGLMSYSHPNQAFRWQNALSTPHGIFVTGNSGIAGEMLRIDVDTTTGALIAPASMFILPVGEALNDLCYYSGALIIATSRGVRVATVQISFVISVTYGPVIVIAGGVNAIFGYGEFGYFAWTNYDGNSTGIGRLDLARFALPETPSMSSDIMAGTAASPVQGTVSDVANFAGVRCFAVSGHGFWSEHLTNYVATASIDVGRIKYGTTEPKIPVYVDLYHDPLPAGASITVTAVDEFGHSYTGGSSNVAGSIHPASFLTINDSSPTEQLDLVFTVNNGTDPTNPPVLRRWTLFSLVTPRRVDQIDVPIMLYRDVKVGTPGEETDLFFDVLAEWQYLKSLEASHLPVLYKEGDHVDLVYVDGVQMDGDKWDPVDHHWMMGLCTVSLITLGASS